jgi:dTDP-4-dehydrorhamnose reductase
MNQRLLVTGASGYLGGELVRQASQVGWHVVGTYLHNFYPQPHITWRQLDVRDRDAVQTLVTALQPAVIIHTAVKEPNDWATNAEGAAHVALAAQRVGAKLVHISSDAIFDGSHGWYTEADAPQPITPYGAAKAAAETAVRAIAPAATVVRTSLIIGEKPYKHMQMVHDMLTGKRKGVLFTDEIRCPIAVQNLAAALLELAQRDIRGVLNVAGGDALSRYELGILLAEYWGYDPERLQAGSIKASGAIRPTEVRLDSSRARSILSTPLRGMREVLGTHGKCTQRPLSGLTNQR